MPQNKLAIDGNMGDLSSITVQPVEQANVWRTILAQLPNPHVLQSWEWGEIKSQTGWSARRFAIYNAERTPIAAFQLLFRTAPARLPFTIGYIPKGPTLDWSNPLAVDAALDHIQIVARKQRCLFVKIDPDVREDLPEGAELLRKLGESGWQYSNEQIQFKNSAFSTLALGDNFGNVFGDELGDELGGKSGDPSDDSAAHEFLLAQMKSKWRYNIRLAKRRGIEIRVGDEADFEQFYDLYVDTSTRDGFAIRPFSYYDKVWKGYAAAQLEENNPAGGVLLLAEHAEDSTPIAGLFLMKYEKRVWYFYGASSERRRRDMPNYLLQWQALCWAIEQGALVYDWWGAPTDPDDPDDGMAGVWRFKQGFGAELQVHIGAWDWAPSRLLYQLYNRMMPLLLRVSRIFRTT